MTSKIYFDNSLATAANLVAAEWGVNSVKENIFLRDIAGKLTIVVLAPQFADKSIRNELGKKLVEKLGAYVDDSDNSVVTPEQIFEERDALVKQARVSNVDGLAVLGIDRRAIGADWLQSPVVGQEAPARFVFASLKGGVGRSTALCVLAAHLASSGRRVLAVDMDLEAPGLGNLLLDQDTLPNFGLLDYLVESAFHDLDSEFFADLVGPSWLGAGRGRVDVIPALGKRSLENPQNVLAKLARAYLSGTGFEQDKTHFTALMQTLLAKIAEPSRYDAVLIDARAGLHETTASAVLGLGANIFLFGSNQPQTFSGFRLIFASLGALPNPEIWRNRLRVVHAKRLSGEDQTFDSEIQDLFETYLPSENGKTYTPDLSTLSDTFEVDWADLGEKEIPELDAPESPAPVSIVEDERFRIFDPAKERFCLDEKFYDSAFREFLDLAVGLVDEAIDRGDGV